MFKFLNENAEGLKLIALVVFALWTLFLYKESIKTEAKLEAKSDLMMGINELSTKGYADELGVRIALQHFSRVINSDYKEYKIQASEVLEMYVKQRTGDEANKKCAKGILCSDTKDVLFAQELIKKATQP